MALTHERNKSSRTKRGCILCFNMGAASPTFAYIVVKHPGMYGNPHPVIKEVGLCFKHCKARTEKNQSGILDPEVGVWRKTMFGKMPEREGLYQLFGGPENYRLITGPSGKVPTWW